MSAVIVAAGGRVCVAKRGGKFVVGEERTAGKGECVNGFWRWAGEFSGFEKDLLVKSGRCR